MVPRGSKVFIDANAIVGVYETGCWKAIAAAYKFESAAFCIEEATRRNWSGSKLITVEPDEIKKWVAAIPVSKDEIVKIDLMLRGATDVHDGEKALLTLALGGKAGRLVALRAGWGHASGLAPPSRPPPSRLNGSNVFARDAGQGGWPYQAFRWCILQVL